MDITSELSENNIFLLMLSREKYHSCMVDALKAIEKNVVRSCYICINDPYSFVSANLKKNSINQEKFFFVDTITRKVQSPSNTPDCIFVSAPNALTEISLAFSKSFTEEHCNALVFDSLSAMMIYENTHSIIQFIHALLTKIRISNSKAYFVSIKDDASSELIKDMHMFVDKVIEIG